MSAIVLANLCVSYIMTSQNEEAEELMRKIEKEEEQLAYEDPDKKVYHLCIVNLVIGLVYQPPVYHVPCVCCQLCWIICLPAPTCSIIIVQEKITPYQLVLVFIFI